MYEIKLFGSGQVYFDGKAIPGFPGQQHCILFYYLLLNRHSVHTREQLATLFWGDSPAKIARKNLRNSLWRLSQAFQSVGGTLEALIGINGECISFAQNINCQIDIDKFETAARYSQPSSRQELGVDQIRVLEEAVELYKGDLLEGVYEDWCTYEREHRRLAFLNMLIRLVDHHVSKGDYARGLEYGQRILALDPTREKIHRQIMMIHWLTGDREAAIQQYRSCCEILQTELGLKPMLETQHLHESILRSSSPANEPPRKSVQLPNREATSPTLKEMIHKLHFLEMIIEQTNTELHVLEQMIQQLWEVS
jgi:DNA-binding SARP family transcriptional activator